MTQISLETICELRRVSAVSSALALIFNEFGDPMYDRDPNLVEGVERLIAYLMSKNSGAIWLDADLYTDTIHNQNKNEATEDLKTYLKNKY